MGNRPSFIPEPYRVPPTQPIPKKNMIFTAYAREPRSKRRNLEINVFKNVTGYVEDYSVFWPRPVEPVKYYRFLITQDIRTEERHNYFESIALRQMYDGEKTTHGFVFPDQTREMIQAILKGNEPRLTHPSHQCDFEWIKETSPEILEQFLK